LSPTLATKGRNEPSLTTNQNGCTKKVGTRRNKGRNWHRRRGEGNDQQTRGKLPPTRGEAPMKKKEKKPPHEAK